MVSITRTYLRWIQGLVVVSLFIPLLTAFCTRLLMGDPIASPRYLFLLTASVGGTAFLAFVLRRILSRGPHLLEEAGALQDRHLAELDVRYVALAIALSAGLSLFLELSVIRWQACIFTLFAFYKNIGLLACFAGLGLGYALSQRPSVPLFASAGLLGWQVVLLQFLRYNGGGLRSRSLLASPIVEQLNMEFATATQWPSYVAIYAFLTVVFLLSAMAFIPVGQLCGRLMRRMPNLKAYGWNLLGSLCGVLALLLASGWWTPPILWFAVALVAFFPFQGKSPRACVLLGLCAAITLAALAWPPDKRIHRVYSPYQVIERTGQGNWMRIGASGIHFQTALDLSAGNPARERDPFLKAVRGNYEAPYRFHGDVKRAALVGAGTGNDVAAAVRLNVQHVAAIEIDPVILEMGKAYHPELPYNHHAVRPVIDDARSFFRMTGERYDAVVYGFLDSHAVLSHASNIRLDSYVYTVEGLREARDCLRENGVLSLTFNILSPELGRKIFLMITEAFDGQTPWCIRSLKSDYGAVTFIARRDGPTRPDARLLAELGFEDCTALYADAQLEADPSTDDWPFLYMPQRVYPYSYLAVLALAVALLAAMAKGFSARPWRGGEAGGGAIYFFLGAGFMLIETKGITELGLVFGNTWQVIGFVIAGVLVMAYLANLAVLFFRPQRPWVPFALLLLSLGVGWYLAGAGGFPPTTLGKATALAVLTCPLLFSGLVFSIVLRPARDIAGAMAANILGAMVGGMLEYNAMYFGFRFLYVLAAIVYVAALALYVLRRPAANSRSEASV